MIKIAKNTQFIPESCRNVAYEDFDIRCSVKVPKFKEVSNKPFFLISMRVKSPYLKVLEESHVNPQSNLGTKQYFLAFWRDGSALLQKTESVGGTCFWREVTNDDGRKIDIPNSLPNILGNVKDAFSGDQLKIEITARAGNFKVTVNDRQIMDATDEIYYPKGYLSLSAIDEDIYVEDITVIPASWVDLKITQVQPTPLFVKGEPLKQVAYIHYENNSAKPLKCFADIQLGMFKGVENIGVINPGVGEAEVFLPDIKEPSELTLGLYAEGFDQPIQVVKTDWKPQRKRKLWLFTSAHEDLGYCGYINKLKEEMAEYLELAKQIGDSTEMLEAEHRYKFVVEHMWWLLGYADLRSSREMKELVEKYIKTGRIEPMFIHSGTHTQWNQYEQLARSTYFGRREAKERWGIDAVTAIYADTPGITWSAAQVFAKAGAKYIINAKGPWRYEKKKGTPNAFFHNAENTFPYYEAESSQLMEPFYWEGPNGKDRLLVHNIWSYGGDRRFNFSVLKGFYDFQRFIVEYLDFKKDYTYDDLLEPCYTDHLIPNVAIVDLIGRWKSKYEYPKLIFCNPREYFEHMEKEYADRIPVYHGEIPNAWADYATIDPESFAKKRNVANEFPFLEFLAALVRTKNPGVEYPYKEIYDIMWRLMEFDEHCWATMLPPSKSNVFNNDIMKKGNVVWAERIANLLQSSLLKEMNERIGSQSPCRIVIWNPLVHMRTDIGKINIDTISYSAFEIIDESTGDTVPYQFINSNQIIFEAKNIPACGYKVFNVVESKEFKVQSEIEENSSSVSNEFYDITFSNGNVEGIYDKKLKRQLVDNEAPYKFNQFLYVHTEHYVSPDIKVLMPEINKVVVEKGEIAVVIRMYGQEIESGAKLEQVITLYNSIKRIDVENRQYDVRKLLYEGCMGKHYGDIGNRYMDNFFYAFPFAADNFDFNIELAGGVVDVKKDILPIGVHDFFMCQNWIDVGNKDYGITLFTKEAPVLHLGEIRYNCFDMNYVPQKPYVYSYAVSNRMAGLHTRSLEDCDLIFNYSIISHGNSWQEANIPKWAWEMKCPLICNVVNSEEAEDSEIADQASFIEISNTGVQLSAFKYHERPGEGYVLRLIETLGKPSRTKVYIPFMDIDRIWEASLVEDKQREIVRKSNNSFEIDLLPFDVVTIVIKAKGDVIPAVYGVKSADIHDNRISLSWDKVKNAEGYYVCRGDQPDFTALQYNIVGYTCDNSFTDCGLNMGTTYYYKVFGVDRWNNKGQESGALAATTTKDNISSPKGIEEIRVTAIDENTLGLTWKTSKEKDIAWYEIYRAENEDLSGNILLDKVAAEHFYIQFYHDSGLKADTTYYYTILPVDIEGNKAEQSVTAVKRTPGGNWWLVRSYKDKKHI